MTEKTITQVSSLRPGSYVIIDGIACGIKSIQTSRTGKHGHAKCRVEAIGLINQEKKIIVSPAHDSIDVPIINKRSAQVLSISNDLANVMDTETYETFDIKIPDDLKGEIQEGIEILYWTILNNKIIKQVKK